MLRCLHGSTEAPHRLSLVDCLLSRPQLELVQRPHGGMLALLYEVPGLGPINPSTLTSFLSLS